MARSGRSRGRRVVTRLGWWLLGIGATLASVGFLRGDVWLYLISLVTLSAVVVSLVAAPAMPHVGVVLLTPPVQVVDRTGPGRVDLHAGPGGSPRHHLRLSPPGGGPVVELLVEALAPGERRGYDVDLRPGERGVHHQMLVVRTSTAPFDLVRRTHLDLVQGVSPVAAGIDEAGVQPATTPGDDGAGPMRLARAGPEVHALRAWAPGDGTGIHWRATVRRGAPVVVDREAQDRTSLVVVAGPASGPEETDAVIARAAGIALRAAREGADVRLLSAGGTEVVSARNVDALTAWTVRATPVPGSAADAELAVSLAGVGGRVVVVRGTSVPRAGGIAAAASDEADVVEVQVAGRAPVAPAAPVPRPLSRPLARATLGSLAAGLLALAGTGVLSPSVTLGWAVAIAAAGYLGLLRPATFADVRARTAAALLLALVTGALAYSFASGDVPALAAATAVCGVTTVQLVSARTRRDALVAMGLGPVMLVAAAGFAPSAALVVPTVLIAVACLLGLSAAAQDALSDDVPEPAAPPVVRRRAGGVAGVPVAAVIGTGLVAFLVLPLGSAPSLGNSLLGARDRTPTRAEQAAALTPDFLAGGLSLDTRGHLSDTPVLEVRAGAPALWRSTVMDQVDGGMWTREMTQAQLSPSSDGVITVPPDPSEAGAPAGTARSYDVRAVDAGPATDIGGVLVAPGPIRTVAGPSELYQWNAATFAAATASGAYTVSAAPRTDIDTLASAGTGPDRTEPTYTSLGTVTDRERALARSLTAGTVDRVAAVRAVESWLRTNIRYQLDAPLPPEGQDSVDFLLFESRAGFCEHFAAAEVTLLRLAGIPSRLASGYAVSAAHQDTPGWWTVRESDAHAWVEVWVPGHGWVTSDPTAGSALLPAIDERSLLARALGGWTALWATDSSRRGVALVLLLATSLAAVGVVLVRRRRSRSGPGRESGSRSPSLEPLPAFARFRAALSADGPALGPGDGVAEVRRAASAAAAGAAASTGAGAGAGGDAALLAALDVVERTLYDRAMPSSQARLAAADLLDRRTAELVARRTLVAAR